jgi:predicted MFS family arabinose efflux permease
VTPLFLAALAIPLPLPLVLVVAAAAGFGVELFNVYWVTALQQHIADEVLARVNSYDALGSFVFIPLGLSIAGPVADGIGLTHALWLAAAVDAGAMLCALAVRDVRQLRRLEPLPVAP